VIKISLPRNADLTEKKLVILFPQYFIYIKIITTLGFVVFKQLVNAQRNKN